MREDSKPLQDVSIIYDETKLFHAVRDDRPVGFFEQDELIWQAQYYDETSVNTDGWERGGFYATPESAITGAKRGKTYADLMKSLFG